MAPGNQFTTSNEKHLHLKLKEWLSEPGDRFEVGVDGYVIDIVRDDLLIEIQTRNFSSIRKKLKDLVESHAVRLIHPIACEKRIVKLSEDEKNVIGRRKSPKKGDVLDVFKELVSLPELIRHSGFSLEIILMMEEEVVRHHKKGYWRRKGWETVERRLLDIKNSMLFRSAEDLAGIVPMDLNVPFTTADMAEAIGKPRHLCQKIVYCLKKMDVISGIDRKKSGVIYVR